MASALERLAPPRRVGDMTLVARIGEGGMATVYLAAVGRGAFVRPAAVKLLRKDLADEEYRTRFLDEARVVVRLHHNNLVDVRAAGEVDGRLYIAMELVEGRDLADVWDRCAELGRPVPVPLSVHVVREVLRGLHYAHTAEGLGLVHRDVSPSNVLVDWQGAVRLADFGLATSAIRMAVTLPGVVFGKVGYMSPEQARREPLDARADVYACGVVLWELLTGRPLREAGTDTDAVARGRVPPPSRLSRRVDPALDAIVARATASDREERFPTAGAFLDALSGWLADRAAGTGQETVARFLAEIFGDVADRERREIRQLLLSVAGSDRTLILARSRPARRGTPEIADMTPSTSHAGVLDEDGESLAPGTVVGGRYRIVELLGRGGMGAVYLAEHLEVGRSVAIKVLSLAFCRDATTVERFRAEARTASAIGHPNIVEVFDAGSLDDGRAYLVMELLSGQSLYEVVEQEGPQPVDRALRWLREVARALRAAHQVGVVHRDLKPENVMLARIGEEDRIKVLDFGISTRADGRQGTGRLTQAGQALGTPEYMAPEQARGDAPTPAIDIYAFGILAFELLAGHPPLAGASPAETIARKLTERPPPLASVRSDVPPALADLVDRCLAPDPADRPASMDQVLGEVEAILRGLPRPSDPGREPAPRADEPRRRALPWGWIAAGLLVLAAAGGVGLAVLSNARDRSPPPKVASASPATPPAPPAEAGPEGGPPAPPAGSAGTPAESPNAGASAVEDPPAASPEPARPPAASGSPEPAGPPPSDGRHATGRRREGGARTGKAGAKTAASAACAAARREAADAVRERRWRAVLSATRRAACFPDRAERRRVRMLAHRELGDFEACLSERGPSTPATERIAAFCRKRLGR